MGVALRMLRWGCPPFGARSPTCHNIHIVADKAGEVARGRRPPPRPGREAGRPRECRFPPAACPARRNPERGELPCRMADGYHMGQIERPALGEDAQMVSRRAPIQGMCPASPRPTCRYSIFQVAMPCAVRRARQWRCVTQGRIALRPAAAVNNHRDGEGSAALRQAQLAKLQLIGVVRFNQLWVSTRAARRRLATSWSGRRPVAPPARAAAWLEIRSELSKVTLSGCLPSLPITSMPHFWY